MPEFYAIADAGGGEAFLTTDTKQIMTQLMVLVFGGRHREKVNREVHMIRGAGHWWSQGGQVSDDIEAMAFNGNRPMRPTRSCGRSRPAPARRCGSRCGATAGCSG